MATGVKQSATGGIHRFEHQGHSVLSRGLTFGICKRFWQDTLGAIFTDSTAMVITFISNAFFGNGLGSITWSLVSVLAPSHLIGLTSEMFNLIGNLSSITTPILIDLLVATTDFSPAFTYMTVIAAD